MIQKNYKNGFVALITAIILSLILIVVTVTLNRSSFFTRSAILEAEYKEMSSALAEACVDGAMLRIATTPGYSISNDPVIVGTETCTIDSVSGGTIQTSADVNKSITRLEVIVDLSDDLSVVSWNEI